MLRHVLFRTSVERRRAHPQRLNIQHTMLHILVGGLLPVPDDLVRGLLAKDDAAVLDVGSGSGHWCGACAPAHTI